MKSIEEMTGLEKSAMLLVALGAEAASRVMAYLDEKTALNISREIVKINSLSIEEKEDLIGEFLLGLKKNKGALFGGENVAREMLKAAFGNEKAEDILNNITHLDIEKGFTFLKNIDPDILAAMLEKEHPQTITATLYYLDPAQNARILKNFPVELSKDIVKRMTRIEKPSPKAVLEIIRILTNKYEKIRSSTVNAEKGSGVNSLIDIMNHMDPEQEKRIMDFFDDTLPDVSDVIKEKIFSFDSILYLTHKEVQLLIDEINDDYLIGKALKGAGDEIRFKLLRNMSRNRATAILEEMDNMGPVRLTEINEARNSIIRIMRILNDNGSLVIRREHEKMVE